MRVLCRMRTLTPNAAAAASPAAAWDKSAARPKGRKRKKVSQTPSKETTLTATPIDRKKTTGVPNRSGVGSEKKKVSMSTIREEIKVILDAERKKEENGAAPVSSALESYSVAAERASQWEKNH
mmetsp:Transcript_53443/g.159926  ORF Transcript_53443/g.159926 Transcript_53443/m.159926 type:complete len:124 (+) Transcript_53443:552-923(+)